MSVAPVAGRLAPQVSSRAVADAYDRVARGDPGNAAENFTAALKSAMENVVEAGRAADTQAVAAVTGEANITEVVTAITRAELALQTTTAVRDRVVQAYQDIMRMPI